MKKLLFILAISLTLIILTSCEKANKDHEIFDVKEVYFSYAPDNAECFAVSDDGILYVPKNNTEEDAFNGNIIINAFNLNGEKIKNYEIELNGKIKHICTDDNNVLYFSVKEDITKNLIVSEYETLYSYDTKSQELKELLCLDSFNMVKKISYLNDCLYILGIDPMYINKEYDNWEGDYRYEYDGTVLKSYNISNSKTISEKCLEIIFDDLPSDFSINPNGGIIIFAHDSEGGYYFADVNLNDKSTGKKIYRDIPFTISFAADDKGVVFFSLNGSKLSTNTFVLCHTVLNDDSGISDVMPNVTVRTADSIIYKKGFTFYLNMNTEKIERIKNSVYVKDNPKIKVISSTRYGTDIFSSGYVIDFSMQDYEGFALTVLSRDKSYDICYMGSNQDFSSNIRDKGSFYPLNDVPGVKEFLNSCFPFIKEAATDSDGNIWMIPIDVSVPIIAFNDENCKKIGIDFNSSTLQDFINNLKIAEKSGDGLHYWLNKNQLVHRNIMKYLRSNKTLDTPEFRQLAMLIKDNLFSQLNEDYFGTPSDLAFFMGNTDLLFMSIDSRSFQTRSFLIGRNELKAVAVTDAGSDNLNSADCIYLCVNPDSNNLKSTLEYITAICEYMMNIKDFYMFTDKAQYTDLNYAKELYNIYENSIIDFNISDEIFAVDFDRYLEGDISIDDFIKEADRKLAIYYNE